VTLADIQPFRGWNSIAATTDDNADAAVLISRKNSVVVDSTSNNVQKHILTSSSHIESSPLIVLEERCVHRISNKSV
jgi:hypothetical protein